MPFNLSAEFLWILFGFLGQFVFFMRFVLQWIYSERKGISLIPISFWYLSIVGAIMIFIYAFYRKDPVFLAGQGIAIIIYVRNLMLIAKNKSKESPNE